MILGYSSIGAFPGNRVADEGAFSKFTLSAAGDAIEVQAYVRAVSGTGNVKGVIYADSSNSPGALIAVGAAVAINTTQAWKASALTGTLPAGDYWIGMVCDVAWTAYGAASAGQQTAFKTALTYASPANPMGAETSNGDGGVLSVYATVKTTAALASAGTGAAAAVSGATAGTPLASAGVGAFTGVAANVFTAVLTSTGVGALTGAGNSVYAVAVAVAGLGAFSGAANALFAGVVAAAGTGTVGGVSGATAGSVEASAGTGALVAAGNAVFASVLGAAGIATVSADGQNAAAGTPTPADLNAAGVGALTAVSGSTDGVVLAAAGIGAFACISGATAQAAFGAAGTGSAAFDGEDAAAPVAAVVSEGAATGGKWNKGAGGDPASLPVTWVLPPGPKQSAAAKVVAAGFAITASSRFAAIGEARRRPNRTRAQREQELMQLMAA